MEKEFELLKMTPGNRSDHNSLAGSVKTVTEKDDTQLSSTAVEPAAVESASLLLPTLQLTEGTKKDTVDQVATPPLDVKEVDSGYSGQVTDKYREGGGGGEATNSEKTMANVTDIHKHQHQQQQHNVGIDRSPQPTKTLDLLAVPGSPTDSVQSGTEETAGGEVANNNMAGWAKLRTTVKVATVVNAKTKKKQRKVSGVSRQDSFMKRFSTRYQQRSSMDLQDSEEEESGGAAASSGSSTLLSKSRVHAEIEEKKPFVVKPDGVFMFYWLTVVTVSVLYNLWTCIAREAFTEIVVGYEVVWFVMDGLCDFFYLVDICVQLRTGYLERGLVVYNSAKLARHYTRSRFFVIDIVALLPLDALQFYTGIHPLLRFPRFAKVYRAYRFSYMVETRTVFPNMWRVANLSHLLFLGSHWFAAFYYMISAAEGFRGTWGYPKPEGVFHSVKRKYLKSLYWSTLTLTTIGDLPPPESNWEYVFTIGSYLIGVFVFATIVGQVGNVITNRNASRQEFERLLDGAKAYMRNHNVPMEMQRRVQRWYDYAWSRGRVNGGGDINSLGLLPDKLKTELALHVNLETLKKVTIFQECEPEFLHDLVLKMKAYIFTPGDLICRKGEVAREMFIIADGLLEVISDSGEVLTQMGTGDFFGEIGILNLDGGVNRRTADVRSVGYSELFVLSREDVLGALKDHPEAEAVIKKCAQGRLKELNVHNRRNLKEREARLHNNASTPLGGGLEDMAESSLNLLTKVAQVGKEGASLLANGPSKGFAQATTRSHQSGARSLLQKLLPFKSSNNNMGGRGLYQANVGRSIGLQRRLSKSYSHLEHKTNLGGETEAEIEPLIMSPSLNNVTSGTQSSDFFSPTGSNSLQPLIHVESYDANRQQWDATDVYQKTGSGMTKSGVGDNREDLPTSAGNGDDVIISVDSLDRNGSIKLTSMECRNRFNNTPHQHANSVPTVEVEGPPSQRSQSQWLYKSRSKDKGLQGGKLPFRYSSLRRSHKDVHKQEKWGSDKISSDFQLQAQHIRLEIPFLESGSSGTSLQRSQSEAKLCTDKEQRWWPQTQLCAHSNSQNCLHCLPKLQSGTPAVDCDTSGDTVTQAQQSTTMQHSTSLTFTRPSHRHTIHGTHSSNQADGERKSRASLPNALVVAGLDNYDLQDGSGDIHSVSVDQADDSEDEEEMQEVTEDAEVMAALQLLLSRKLAMYKEKYRNQIEDLKEENRSKEEVISELQHQLHHLQAEVESKLEACKEKMKQEKTNIKSRVRWRDDVSSVEQPAVTGSSHTPNVTADVSKDLSGCGMTMSGFGDNVTMLGGVTEDDNDGSTLPQVMLTDDTGQLQYIP